MRALVLGFAAIALAGGATANTTGNLSSTTSAANSTTGTPINATTSTTTTTGTPINATTSTTTTTGTPTNGTTSTTSTTTSTTSSAAASTTGAPSNTTGTTGVAQEEVVVQVVTFAAVRYDDLIANTTIQTAFINTIKQSIANSVGVPQANVDVELARATSRRLEARGFDRRMNTAAGVSATITIRADADTPLATITTTLQQNTTATTLTSAVQDVPNLATVVTGDLSALTLAMAAPVTQTITASTTLAATTTASGTTAAGSTNAVTTSAAATTTAAAANQSSVTTSRARNTPASCMWFVAGLGVVASFVH